jgi:hypothetical protein
VGQTTRQNGRHAETITEAVDGIDQASRRLVRVLEDLSLANCAADALFIVDRVSAIRRAIGRTA